MHHRDGGTSPNRAGVISSTGISPPDRCVPHQPTSSLPAGYALPRSGRTLSVRLPMLVNGDETEPPQRPQGAPQEPTGLVLSMG
jgi:hypothetical protein